MKRVTHEEFIEKMKQIHGDKFDVVGTYVNNSTKLALRCNQCGNTIYKQPAKMTSRNPEGCYYCNGKNRWKTTDSFKHEVAERYGDEYVVLGDYVKARQSILVRHNDCGYEYFVTPDNLLRGKGCPSCGHRRSKLMRCVEKYLNAHDIAFESEKRFEGCRDQRPLPFDYYLPDYHLCIEVDGIQHFTGWNHDGTSLQYIQRHDQIKTDYCIQNDIRLLRLPYYDYENFDELLNQALYVNTEVIVSGKELTTP